MLFLILFQLFINAGDKALPLYEIGMGAAGQMAPDYPGADEGSFNWLPFPYAIYRGDILKSDRERGTRAEFAGDEFTQFDFSFGGSFALDPNKNEARKGMRANLDWVFEVGPRYSIRLWKGPQKELVRLQLATRGVFSTDLTRVSDQGFVFEPQISWLSFYGKDREFRLYTKASLSFADRRLANFYYEVQDYDVKPGRPRYDGKPGFLGSYVEYAVTYSVSERLRFILGQEFGFYNGSANQASPLFRRNESLSTFAAFIWVFHQSEALAPREL